MMTSYKSRIRGPNLNYLKTVVLQYLLMQCVKQGTKPHNIMLKAIREASNWFFWVTSQHESQRSHLPQSPRQP